MVITNDFLLVFLIWITLTKIDVMGEYYDLLL